MGRGRVSASEGATVAAQPRRTGLVLTERDGFWHVTGRLRVRGKTRRVRRSTGLPALPEHLEAADEILRQVAAEIVDELVHGIHPSVPLAEAVAKFLSRPRRRPLNPIDVQRLVEIRAKFGPTRKLGSIADSEWIQFVERRMAGNKPVTRERYIDLILAFLKWCLAKPRFWLRELPVFERDAESRYRPQRKHRRVAELTPELVGRLAAAASPHMKGQLAALWSTGHRVSSILYGCRLCDYLSAAGREQITFHDTKNGLTFTAHLHPWAAALMADYLKWRGRLNDREAPLFLRPDRKPYNRRPKGGGGQTKAAFRGMVRRAGRELRREALTRAAALRRQGRTADAREAWQPARAELQLLAQLTPHWFRHLLATEMAPNILDGMGQGGWLDMRSYKGYSHDVPARRRAAVNSRQAPAAGHVLDTALPSDTKPSTATSA